MALCLSFPSQASSVWLDKRVPGIANSRFSLAYSSEPEGDGELNLSMHSPDWRHTHHYAVVVATGLGQWPQTCSHVCTQKDGVLWLGYLQAKSLQLCLTLYDPMDCGLLGSSVHGIPQERILETVAIPFPIQGSNMSFLCLLQWKQILYH